MELCMIGRQLHDAKSAIESTPTKTVLLLNI